MRAAIITVFFLLCANYCFSQQSYHIKVSASNVRKAPGIGRCRSGCIPPTSRMEMKIKCANGLVYTMNVNSEVFSGGNANYQEFRSGSWNVFVPSKPISILISGEYVEDSIYGREEFYCVSQDEETTISVNTTSNTTINIDYEECLTANITIESNPLNTLVNGVSPQCYTDFINMRTSDNLDSSLYKWVYRRPGGRTWNTINKFNTYTAIDVTLEDFGGFAPNELIEIAVNYDLDIYSNSKTISFIDCSVQLTQNPPATKNAKCNSSNDGEVTLEFESNIDVENDYQMRFYLFQGTPPTNPTPGQLEDPDSYENVFPDQVFDEHLEETITSDANGNFSYTLEGLDASYTDTNGIEHDPAQYYVVYQEIKDDGLNVTVKSAEITQSFTINRPSEINIDVPLMNIAQPNCFGDKGEVTVDATGGGLAPNVNASLEYGKGFAGGTLQDVQWQNSPTFSGLEEGRHLFYARTSDECYTTSETIDIIVPEALAFTDELGGQASSSTTADGIVSLKYSGGTFTDNIVTNGAFQLQTESSPGVFTDTALGNIDHIPSNSEVRFNSLPIGTYRITLTDSNDCMEESGDLVVETSPEPVLGTVTITQGVSCSGQTDAVVQAPVSFGATNSTPTTISYRLYDSTNSVIRDGSIGLDNDLGTNEIIEIVNLPAGEGLTLSVISSLGNFNDINTVVSSDPFDITDAQAIVFDAGSSITTNVSCFGSSDGRIELAVSGSNNYEYALELLPDATDWRPLPTDRIIDGLAAGNYPIILRNSESPSCQSQVYSPGFTIGSPDAIVVNELIDSHKNLATFGDTNGELEISVVGGTGTYDYAWEKDGQPFAISANSTNTFLKDLSFGEYQVTISDSNNSSCSTISDVIEITQPEALDIISFNKTADACNGIENGSITAEFEGTGPITLSLINTTINETASYITENRTYNFTDLKPGDYMLTISDGVSPDPFVGSIVATIDELAGITADVAKTDVSCDGLAQGTITVSGMAGGAPFTSGANALTGYEYRINDTFNTFQAEATFTNVAVGNYTLTVRDALGCEFNTPVEIVQNGVPVLDPVATIVNDASSDTSLDGSVVLGFGIGTDTASLSFEWSGPGVSGITTKDLNGVGTGTYQVVISAPGDCNSTEVFTIDVEAAFSIQPLTGTPAICSGTAEGSVTANIVATGPVTFNWFEIGDPSTPVSVIANTTERTVTLENRGAGEYYLEIADQNGLTVRSPDNFEIVELPEVSATIVPVPTCSGSNTGSITFIPSGTLTYSYSIDGGTTFQPEPVFENLTDITYNLQVRATESPNCDYVQSGVRIGVSPGMYWDENKSSIVRASGPEVNDGSIIAVFTGGTEPYNYSLNNGTPQLTNVFADLSKGTYSITVTDAAGCSVSQDFEVTEIGPLTISNINVTDASCLGEANGSITTTVTGEGDITFLWTLGNDVNGNPIPVPVSNGTDGPNITGILAGNYILTVTDDNATRFTEAIAVGEPTNSVTVTNVALTDVSCFGGNDGTLEVEAGGGTGPYMYSINGGDYETSNLFEDLSAGNYTISVRDANNCTFTEPTPEILLEPQELGLAFIDIKPVTLPNASDGAISITVEGGLGTYTYSWSGPNGYTSVDKDVLNGEAGDYVVTITDAENASCSYTSDPIKITEPGELIVTLFLNETLSCSLDSDAVIIANVQGDQPFTYQWFEVVNTNTIELAETTNIIGDLPAGTYLLKVTDSNNITLDSTIEISAPTPLNINIDNSTNVICAGEATGSINITVTGGTPPYQYFWSNSATVPDISGLDAGEYIIEVQDEAGCIAQETITITPPGDAIQIVDAAIINVTEYQGIDGSISLDITGGSAPYSYAWTRISNNSITGNQRTISNLAADSYLVTVSDVNGCSVTEIYEVTQPDIVVGTILQPTCSGDSNGSISVLANEGNGTFSYLWNTGATESDINNLAAGTYSVTVTGFESGPINRTYVLENPAPLEVDLGSDRILCAGQTLELDATVDDETATYSWSSDNGFSSSEPNIELTATGNYTVTVQSETGCIAEGNIFVDISSDEINAEFAVSSQVFTGESIIAVDISYPLPDGIEWILPVQAKIETQNRDEAQFSFAEAGEYEVTIITTRGDCVAQKTKKIVVVARDGLITEEDTKNGKKLIEDFLVYPNPSDGRFTADVTLTEIGDINIRVFSLANNALMASKRDRDALSYSIPFDLSGLPAGVYAVLLETPYGQTLRKVIIK